MTIATCHTECEDWIRLEWLTRQFGQPFRRERLRLTSGGDFRFDAVSADHSIAATITTDGATTASGKPAVRKLMKVRADMLFLLMTDVARRVVLVTERDMYELCVRENDAGRVPRGIEFLHVELPEHVRAQLEDARRPSKVNGEGGKAGHAAATADARSIFFEAPPRGEPPFGGRADPHAPPASWLNEDAGPF